ncbi:MAG: hypothetical protein U0667_04575 [Chloroflexota bacterium]
MIGRTRRVALVAASLFALSVPTMAQDATSSVAFDGIGFSFDHSLGRSVNILRVPRQRPSTVGVVEPSPAHVVFALYGRQAESKRTPRVWDVPGTVNVYWTSALDGYELASRQLTELQRLLSERPDPATLEASAGLSGELPYLPIEEAAQAIAARVTYIDTPELSGVAYVTGFRQDVFPFARGDFWYTFQGLSTDGRWYVAVDWLLDASMFPATITQADARRVGTSASRWERYVKRTVATLDAAEPTAFTPSLTVLDDLVRSIDFASVVAPSPSASPVPSIAPSIAPSAAPTPTDAVAASAAPTSSVAASTAP